MDERFLVFVSCFTFNHAPFIKDAMEGFCLQETSFPFICGIVDDASTDGEQDVIRQYLEDNFDLGDSNFERKIETDMYVRFYAKHKTNKNCCFVVYLLKRNHYQDKKSKTIYIEQWRSRSQYVAICEGDDYWISKDKLQRQFDFLEHDSSYGLVYTKANVFSVQSGAFTGTVGNGNNSFEEMLLSNPIPTLTVMFRTDANKEYIDNVDPVNRGWRMGDYPRWLFIAANYKIHFINEVTAVYRANVGSASRPRQLRDKLLFLESTESIRLYFCDKYAKYDSKALVENAHEESCVRAAIAYKEKKKGFQLLFGSRRLSLSQRVTLLWGLLRS